MAKQNSGDGSSWLMIAAVGAAAYFLWPTISAYISPAAPAGDPNAAAIAQIQSWYIKYLNRPATNDEVSFHLPLMRAVGGPATVERRIADAGGTVPS